MASVEAEVLKEFLVQLSQCGDVPASLVSRGGVLISAVKLPKADQLADVYAKAAGESVL